jgi:hypothetical protein
MAQPDTRKDAGRIQHPPHQHSDPDPLPEAEQNRLEQAERDAARKPAHLPGKD